MIVFGKLKIKLKGRLAWYMHRGYHGMAVPTLNRKIRVFADWTLGDVPQARGRLARRHGEPARGVLRGRQAGRRRRARSSRRGRAKAKAS